MSTPNRRRCRWPGCTGWITPPGTLCAEHRAAHPPRAYHDHRADPPGQRRCPRCEQYLPVESFTLPGGRVQGNCRVCRLAATREYKARHRDRLLAKRRAGYAAANPTRSYAAQHRQALR